MEVQFQPNSDTVMHDEFIHRPIILNVFVITRTKLIEAG